MARDLKSFRNGARPEEKRAHGSAEENRGAAFLNGNANNNADMDMLMNQYGGKNDNELMNELFKMTDRQKADGSFDAGGMYQTAASIMPMLTPEQQQKLNRIINMLTRGGIES